MVVGLGNPGSRYAGTRHNVGFAVVHRLVDRLAAKGFDRNQAYEAWRGALPAGSPLVLVTPLGYMNRSGEALRAYAEEHGFAPAGSLVVVDDVYLPLGTIRLRASGSDGGHNGLASIEAAFATRSYPRLRIGVGHADESAALGDHVLSGFEDEERPVLADALERAEEAVLLWATEGLAAAMNRFNVKPRDERTNDTEDTENDPAGER